MKPAAARQRRVFAIPAVVAVITLVGLIGGLVGDGAADVLSWIALGSCLAMIGWAIRS